MMSSLTWILLTIQIEKGLEHFVGLCGGDDAISFQIAYHDFLFTLHPTPHSFTLNVKCG